MKGFTDSALILLSNIEEFSQGCPNYQYMYRKAVHNLITYLNSMDIGHDCFITDSMATHLPMENVRWLATGAPEDMFFIKSYCSVPAYDSVPLSDNALALVRKRYPIPKGLTPEERFGIVSKRIKYCEREIIKSYKFVVVFGNQFVVHSKAEDGKAILYVNAKKFYTELMMGGEKMPINDFMRVDYASMCLCDWRS